MNHPPSIRLPIFLLAFFCIALLEAQALTGTVTNSSGTPLVGATVVLLGEKTRGTTVNTNGRYSLSIPDVGRYQVVASYVGHRADTTTIVFSGSATATVQDFVLAPANGGILVEVTDRHLLTERQLELTTERLSMEQIRQIPLMLGEADVLRSLQFLPGVQTGAAGQTGLNVRGGSPDQNLILMDGIPIYNPNHVFGFLSAFNPDAVAGVTFRRGGFPARYGGRLSSVVDVEMRAGTKSRTVKRVNLGPLLAKISLDGPLGSKTTYLFSGRRSLFDLFLSPGRSTRQDNNNPQNGRSTRNAFGFSDANVKIIHEPNERDRLSLTSYWGRDRYDRVVTSEVNSFSTRVEELQNWGNLIGSLNYQRIWSDRLTQRVLMGYTGYRYETGDSEVAERGDERVATSLLYRSGVTEISGRTDFIARLQNDVSIRTGAGIINRTFKTGDFELLRQNNRPGLEINQDTTLGRPTRTTYETFAYLEAIKRFGGSLSLNAGLHLAGLDAKQWSLQPRLSMRKDFGERTAITLGASAMRQYLHLIVSGSLGLPNDVWVPATEALPPEDSWQVSLGLQQQVGKNWEVEVDAYYKFLSSTANYLPGRGITSLAPWESLLTVGTGEAYGVETKLTRTTGRLSGFLAYTANWSWRQFEELNFGQRFPYRYDRRHDLRLVSNFALRPDKVLLSANFIYATGNPVTVSNNLLRLTDPFRPGALGAEVEFQSFTAVNDYRLAATHRLDLGLTFRKRRGHRLREISVGVYNSYARRNPYYVNLRLDPDPPGGQRWRGELVQVSLLRALPYLTYSIQW